MLQRLGGTLKVKVNQGRLQGTSFSQRVAEKIESFDFLIIREYIIGFLLRVAGDHRESGFIPFEKIGKHLVLLHGDSFDELSAIHLPGQGREGCACRVEVAFFCHDRSPLASTAEEAVSVHCVEKDFLYSLRDCTEQIAGGVVGHVNGIVAFGSRKRVAVKAISDQVAPGGALRKPDRRQGLFLKLLSDRREGFGVPTSIVSPAYPPASFTYWW